MATVKYDRLMELGAGFQEAFQLEISRRLDHFLYESEPLTHKLHICPELVMSNIVQVIRSQQHHGSHVWTPRNPREFSAFRHINGARWTGFVARRTSPL